MHDHADPAVAIPELDEDRPIPYRVVPTVLGVPLSRRVVEALDVLDAALAIAQLEQPGVTLGDLCASLRAAQVRGQS